MQNNGTNTTMVVPSFGHCQELKLNMEKWYSAISRMPEAQNLAASNYSNLEYIFQEAWREAKVNAIKVGDAIRKALQNVEEIKADVILEEIPKLLENMPKSNNSTDYRKAVLAKNEKYQQANEHLDKLESLLEHFESHMKMMENTSRFLKKQMDYYIRSGSLTNTGIVLK